MAVSDEVITKIIAELWRGSNQLPPPNTATRVGQIIENYLAGKPPDRKNDIFQRNVIRLYEQFK